MNGRRLYAAAWTVVLVCTLAGMIYAAFRPFERSPTNDALFDTHTKSLRFGSQGGSGIALLSPPLKASEGTPPSLTVGLWLRTAAAPGDHGEALLAIDDGVSPALLRIGQKASFVRLDWREKAGGRMRPRFLGLGDVFLPAREHFVAVVTSNAGTRVHVDGVVHDDLSSDSAALRADFAAAGNTMVVLGNDATGRVGWRGELLGYFISQRALADAELAALEALFRSGASLAGFDATPSFVSSLNFAAATTLPSDIGLPLTLANLRRPVLQSDLSPPDLDALQNLFGFMPLGLLLMLAPGDWRRASWGRVALAALACCAFSLSIELAQVQFPARFSSLYDWGLNTLGGLAGALLTLGFAKWVLPRNVASPSNPERGIRKA